MKAYMNEDGSFVLEASEAMEKYAFRQWYGEQVDAGGVEVAFECAFEPDVNRLHFKIAPKGTGGGVAEDK